MTPPRTPDTRKEADQGTPSAVVLSLATIKKRSDFLACAKARKARTPAFFVQGRFRNDNDPTVRVGYTCSKKVGNAVARNQAKRRLRAMAAHILPPDAKLGWDYVLVGFKETTATYPFEKMCDALRSALAQLHKD